MKICSKNIWVARDKDNTLWAYSDKPLICEDGCWGMELSSLEIDSSLFPNLKCEDGPIEVEIKPLKKKKDTEHTCDTCKFKNESPRCMTGVPCNEWRKSNWKN